MIENKDYKPGVGVLVSPLNDVCVVGDAPRSVGFEVLTIVQKATRTETLSAIYEFAWKLSAAGPEAVGSCTTPVTASRREVRTCRASLLGKWLSTARNGSHWLVQCDKLMTGPS